MSNAAPATFTTTSPALIDHPAIKDMAVDMFTMTPDMLATLTHDDGTPTTRFMDMANDRFAEATGETAPRLGDVAKAVLARFRALLEEVNAGLLAALEERQAATAGDAPVG
ncbi:hypothetical protein ACWGH2_41900 [Streptomyces sp. NPDC054871]